MGSNMPANGRFRKKARGFGRLTIAIYAMLFAGSAAYGQKGDEAGDRGTQIFVRMLQTDSTITVEGDQVTEVDKNGRHGQSWEHVIQAGLAGKKITYSAPPSMSGSILVDDGATFWHYIKRRNALEKQPSAISRQRQRLPQTIRAARRGNLLVTIADHGTVAGRACTIIEVRRKRDVGPWRRFSVDDATGASLRTEQHRLDGSLESDTYYTSVSFNVSIPPNTFAPPGAAVGSVPGPPAQVTPPPPPTQQASFPLLQPSYIPDGYRLQSTDVGNFGRRELVTRRYSNGLNTLSLVQTPAARGLGDRGTRWARNDAVTVVTHGYRVVLVGNLPHDVMTQMITSLH